MTEIQHHSICAIQLPSGKYYAGDKRGEILETRIFAYACLFRNSESAKKELSSFKKETKLIKHTRIALQDLEGNDSHPKLPDGVEVERGYVVGYGYKAKKYSDEIHPHLRGKDGTTNFLYGIQRFIPTKEEAVELAKKEEKILFEREMVRYPCYVIEVITIEEEVEVNE